MASIQSARTTEGSGGNAGFSLSKPPPQFHRGLVYGVTLVIGLFALILALRSGDTLRYPDEKDYHALTENLLERGSYLDGQLRVTATRPPGYPFLLAGIYSVWHRPLAGKLFNALACALTALILAWLASAIVPGAGSIAPLLALFYPVFLYTSSTLLAQTPGTLLLVCVLFLLVRWHASWGAAVAGGLVFGFLVLMIPSFLLWLPLFAAYLLAADRLRRAPLFRRAILFFFCAALAIAPWAARNYIQFHAIIPVSTNGGFNLLLGNSPNARPDSGTNVDLSEYQARAEGMNEVEQDKFYKQAAIDYVKTHPAAAASLYIRKVAHYFGYRERLYTASEGSRLRDLILLVTYYPLLLLALGRLLLIRRFRPNWTELFLYFVYFGNAFLSAIFFTRIRFRMPFDALLVVLAAISVTLLWRWWRASRTEPAPNLGEAGPARDAAAGS